MGRGKRVEQVLSSLPEPSDSQQVVVVTGLPGGNLLNVQSADGRAFLCRVPAKFRNRVWVIKGGYLIVEMAAGDADGEALGKVQASLAHHLYRDQIKHLKGVGKWPAAFEDEPASEAAAARAEVDVYATLDDELHQNTNRRAIEQDEDESEEEEEEEEEEAVEAAAAAMAAAEVQDAAPVAGARDASGAARSGEEHRARTDPDPGTS